MQKKLSQYYACFDDVGDGKPYAVKDRNKKGYFQKTIERFKTAEEAKTKRDLMNATVSG